MRFSDNGYYIEKYVKCANCGMLVYGKGQTHEVAGKPQLFCSDWCAEWATLRAERDGYFNLKIVQPKLPIEAKLKRKPKKGHKPDMVMMNILDSTMVSICREMGITMMRTAFSPIFNEGLDFSCVLFDRDANVIGQGEFCPAQIAAAIFASPSESPVKSPTQWKISGVM